MLFKKLDLLAFPSDLGFRAMGKRTEKAEAGDSWEEMSLRIF